jgi:uncharacterized protein
MSGETDLARMLASMSPRLVDGEFVFCSIPGAVYGDHAELQPVAAVREAEGLTLVLPRAAADAQGIAYKSVFRQITLQVHSSLDAVGLTAAFSARLTEHGISTNVIAGSYHDHIFVQSESAQPALRALEVLAREADSSR